MRGCRRDIGSETETEEIGRNVVRMADGADADADTDTGVAPPAAAAARYARHPAARRPAERPTRGEINLF